MNTKQSFLNIPGLDLDYFNQKKIKNISKLNIFNIKKKKKFLTLEQKINCSKHYLKAGRPELMPEVDDFDLNSSVKNPLINSKVKSHMSQMSKIMKQPKERPRNVSGYKYKPKYPNYNMYENIFHNKSVAAKRKEIMSALTPTKRTPSKPKPKGNLIKKIFRPKFDSPLENRPTSLEKFKQIERVLNSKSPRVNYYNNHCSINVSGVNSFSQTDKTRENQEELETFRKHLESNTKPSTYRSKKTIDTFNRFDSPRLCKSKSALKLF